MIIEGAFLKLPELLLRHVMYREQYEATLTNRLAMAVLLELSARNVELPMNRIHIEKPYPEISNRVDPYVDLVGLFNNVVNHNLYGMKIYNWIEAKFFGGVGRQIGHQQKVSNAGKIALDLLRLCLFVREDRSAYRSNGRYLLVVFNREPGDYVAFRRRVSDFPEREWLDILSEPGVKQIHIDLTQEPPSFKKVFGGRFVECNENLDLKCKVLTRTFSPIEVLPEVLYWGYLVRIVDFEISLGNDKLIYRDTSSEFWTEKQKETQKRLIKRVIKMQQT